MRKKCICLSEKEYERVTIIKMAVEGFYSNRETTKLLNHSVRQVNNILLYTVIRGENLKWKNIRIVILLILEIYSIKKRK
jgi:hypothetical protein